MLGFVESLNGHTHGVVVVLAVDGIDSFGKGRLFLSIHGIDGLVSEVGLEYPFAGTIEVVAVSEAEKKHKSLFVVIMSFYFNNKYAYDIIVNIIDNAVMCCYST